MSKIARKSAKIFGTSAGFHEISQYGSLAANAINYSTDPAVIQNLSQWLAGWFAAVVGGNSPAIEDMNAFCFVVAYQIAYIMQAGVPEYDTGTTYYTGSLVNDGTGTVFISLADTNLNNALTNGAWWCVLGGRSSVKTTAYNVTTGDDILKADCTSGGVTFTLPAASVSKGKTWKFIKIDSSANAMTLSASQAISDSTTQSTTNQWTSMTVFCDGTQFYLT